MGGLGDGRTLLKIWFQRLHSLVACLNRVYWEGESGKERSRIEANNSRLGVDPKHKRIDLSICQYFVTRPRNSGFTRRRPKTH